MMTVPVPLAAEFTLFTTQLLVLLVVVVLPSLSLILPVSELKESRIKI
jgi:hypothetical protein